MQELIKLDDIEVKARISDKAKHIAIRITAKKQVELVIPRGANLRTAHQFLLTKELWIRNKLRKFKAVLPQDEDLAIISILGNKHELILNDKNITEPILINNQKIIISSVIPSDKINSLITHALKKLIKLEINKYAQLVALQLNVVYKNISIKDTSSRWGSCSSGGNLSFSWRLILAPRYVMEYVVVHELCHLSEMNHSHRFWRLVNSAFARHKEARLWLKRNGKNLHEFGLQPRDQP